MTKPKLTKMDGLGNTFVVLTGPYAPKASEVIALCREYGPKPADGLLVAAPIDEGSVRMQYWNTDGTLAEMCGNGLRCLAKYSRTNSLINASSFTVQTDVGPLKVVCNDDSDMVEVQVGKVVLAEASTVIEGNEFFEANVGNPHAITFVADVEAAPVTTLGPMVETNAHFPNKTNVEFAQIISKNHIRLRIWERSVGETKACGTGMVASSAVFVKNKGGQYPVTIEVPGGEATVWIDEDGYTRMLGPVQFN